MRSLRRVRNLVEYEWKRFLATEKILLLVLALLLQIFTLYWLSLYSRVLRPEEVQAATGTMWLAGVLTLQGLFTPLIASIIAGSSMAEEYERGRADILLTKPITRREYLAGKYLGGLLILSVVIALVTITSVGSGWAFFGPQEHLQYVPVMYVALLYANLLMFSLTFMLSEVVRSSIATMIAATGILIGSLTLEDHLWSLYSTTEEELYQTISNALPSWSPDTFPTDIAYKLIGTLTNPFIDPASGRCPLAAVLIAGYTIPSIVVAYFRFRRSDIAHKVGG